MTKLHRCRRVVVESLMHDASGAPHLQGSGRLDADRHQRQRPRRRASVAAAPRTRCGSSAACSAPGSAPSAPGRTGWCRCTMSHSSTSRSRSACVACFVAIAVEQPCICTVPARQGMHLPHDSSMQNSMKNARHLDHVRVLIHDDHAARAHDRAELRQRLVIDRRVEHVRRECSRRKGRRSAPP